ncbi:hypothetical protein Tco_0442689 [Tanacetum coccineum]
MHQRSGQNSQHQAGESMEEFVRRYKLECRDVKGAPECMKISGFMHGITNPELIKRLHDKIPKSVDEMMRVTTTFLRGEVAASNCERKKSFLLWKQQQAGHKQNFKKGGFRNQQRSERKHDREVGHTTDECMYLKRQFEEMLKAGKLSHLIKELKQSNGKDHAKAAKKGETSGKDKPLAILMVQPWHRVAKQRITKTFSLETVISFPPLGEEDGTEGPMIIEAEMGGISSTICVWTRVPLQKSYMNTALIDSAWSSEAKWSPQPHQWSPSPYNRIIGRPGVMRIQAVPSTAHEILNFPMTGRTVTLRSIKIFPLECTMVSRPGTQQPVIDQVTEEKTQELCGLLRRNLDIFSWKPTDMIGVPRHIAELKLNIREGCLLVRQKKRGQAPERNKAIYEEVEKMVKAGSMKEVHYQTQRW